MSELGSKQGQDENKNTLVFDSANLAEKQQAEHFTNVEGNEARAKQAERQAEAAKKQAETVRANEIKKAAKKADKEAGGSMGGILNFLFGGWHKIVTVLIILAILLAAFLVVKNFSVKLGANISLEKAKEKSTAFESDCASEEEGSGYCSAALEDFEKYIRNESNVEAKIELLGSYEKYVIKEYGDAERVEAFLNENIPSEYNEEQREKLCQAYSDLYYNSNNWEKYVEGCSL